MITTRTGPQPADLADVRVVNLATVLRHVRAHKPCSRADIAASTGLNKATVSSLVADLIERRLLREIGLTEHRIGRPATMLTLDGQPYAAIGLQVAADHLTAVAVDLAGEQLLCWRRAFPAPGRAVSAIAALVNRAVSRVTGEGRQVVGLTVGVPGLVDDAGCVRLSAQLGWENLDLAGELTAALRRPAYEITVDNDANLAVTAEQRYGGHAGVAHLVYLAAGSAVDAGIVLDGRLVRGGRGFAGDLGHLQVDPAGPRCDCGRHGCLQALAGPAALVRQVLPDAEADGPLADLAPELERVLSRARADDPRTLAALDEAGRHLGHAVSILANVINPQTVLLGGYYTALADWLVPAARAELAARTVAPDAGGCRIEASTLGDTAAALGGAARALQAVDAGRLPRLPATG